MTQRTSETLILFLILGSIWLSILSTILFFRSKPSPPPAAVNAPTHQMRFYAVLDTTGWVYNPICLAYHENGEPFNSGGAINKDEKIVLKCQ